LAYDSAPQINFCGGQARETWLRGMSANYYILNELTHIYKFRYISKVFVIKLGFVKQFIKFYIEIIFKIYGCRFDTDVNPAKAEQAGRVSGGRGMLYNYKFNK
jgi:hypothetical protein